MKDVLISMYKQNEQYHAAKETMFWLSTSTYLGFSVCPMKWILSYKPLHSFGFILLALVALVFTFAYIFSYRQNWLKCLSVVKTTWLTRIMREDFNEDQIRAELKKLEKEITRIEKAPRKEK